MSKNGKNGFESRITSYKYDLWFESRIILEKWFIFRIKNHATKFQTSAAYP